jgi:hypothetical protein
MGKVLNSTLPPLPYASTIYVKVIENTTQIRGLFTSKVNNPLKPKLV